MNKEEESAIIEYIKEKPEFLESLSDAIKDICSYMGQILSDEKFMEELKKSVNKQDTAEWIDFETARKQGYKCGSCECLCSNCKEPAVDEYRFCPNCGAKMNESEKEE